MKATKLMIGDWVYNSYHKKNIRWSYGEMFCPNGNPVIGKDLHPIPLTPEILNKNGFKIGHLGTYYIWGFSIGNHYDGYFSPYINVGSAARDLNYVHELQHALRLCGLDELADNFKV